MSASFVAAEKRGVDKVAGKQCGISSWRLCAFQPQMVTEHLFTLLMCGSGLAKTSSGKESLEENLESTKVLGWRSSQACAHSAHSTDLACLKTEPRMLYPASVGRTVSLINSIFLHGHNGIGINYLLCFSFIDLLIRIAF